MQACGLVCNASYKESFAASMHSCVEHDSFWKCLTLSVKVICFASYCTNDSVEEVL